MNSRTEIFKKIIIILIMIIVFNFSFAYKSNATSGVAMAIKTGGMSLLTKPICSLVIGITDGINLASSVFFLDKEKDDDAYDAWSTAADEFRDGNIANGFFSILMSPDKIFSGEVTMLDANIFNAEYNKGNALSDIWQEIKGGAGGSLGSALKMTVSGIYVALRNIAALILLCLLIYTGIRMLLTSASPYKQAEWKKHLIDWVKALCLLMFMHLIMIGIFYISDALADTLRIGFGGYSIAAQIRMAFNNTSIWDTMGIVIVTIMYLYITYLTIVFFISYFKRLVWIVMLITISPFVAITCAIGRNQIFNKWFKEFITAVLIQPFHMLIFYILVGLPLGLSGNASNNPTFLETLINNFSPLNSSSLIIYIYMLLSISMIRPAEKFFMGLADMKGLVAQQASTESGVKTIKKVEKVATETVKTVQTVGAIVATAGAAAPALAAGAGAAGAGAAGAGAAGAGAAEAGAAGAGAAGAGAAGAGAAEAGAAEAGAAGAGAAEAGAAEAGQAGVGTGTVGQQGLNSNDVSDEELNESMGNKNSLKERLKSYRPYQYAKEKYEEIQDSPLNRALNIPSVKESINNTREALGELRDDMYLEGAPQEWKQGPLGTETQKEEIKAQKENGLNAVVNNKNNINYMKQAHNLSNDEAKARLKEAEPFINAGITDIGALDKLIDKQREGISPNDAMKAFAQEVKTEVKTNNVINNQSKISSMAQIIAKESGRSSTDPQVQREAKQTMEAARPYIDKGETNSRVLHELVNLQNSMKKAGIGPNGIKPENIMKLNSKINEAARSGQKTVGIKITEQSSQAMRKIESVMNTELDRRIGKK